jgi:geranylgeranyl pyrophosphate synthase
VKLTAPALDSPRPLAAALRRASAPDGICPLDPSVPDAVWERALIGPAEEFLRRPGKEVRARLVEAGWQLGGGVGPAPEALTQAIEMLHAGSLVVDDVEDDSDERRGAATLHRLYGVPVAINTGNCMYFWALARLGELPLPAEAQLAIYRAAVDTLVRCHQGQALDLGVHIGDLEQAQVAAVVAATTRLKTGALMGLAGFVGAAGAGAAPERAAAIAAFGEAAGIGLQMLDDLGSVACAARLDKGREDLRGGRPTWPWAWLADSADQLTFARLQHRARHVDGSDCDPLAEALRLAVEAAGRAHIRAHLDGALAALTTVIGPSPALDALAAELHRLEASYG